MLTREATPEMILEWKSVWNAYKDRLRPNRKSGADLAAYLTGKYPVRRLDGAKAAMVVTGNVLQNKAFAEKLPKGRQPSPAAFIVENTGEGKKLYDGQDEIFKGTEIFVGIDLETGFFCVEGSSLLWDELCAYRGLDERDIRNYFCVAQYVSALERIHPNGRKPG